MSASLVVRAECAELEGVEISWHVENDYVFKTERLVLMARFGDQAFHSTVVLPSSAIVDGSLDAVLAHEVERFIEHIIPLVAVAREQKTAKQLPLVIDWLKDEHERADYETEYPSHIYRWSGVAGWRDGPSASGS